MLISASFRVLLCRPLFLPSWLCGLYLHLRGRPGAWETRAQNVGLAENFYPTPGMGSHCTLSTRHSFLHYECMTSLRAAKRQAARGASWSAGQAAVLATACCTDNASMAHPCLPYVDDAALRMAEGRRRERDHCGPNCGACVLALLLNAPLRLSVFLYCTNLP